MSEGCRYGKVSKRCCPPPPYRREGLHLSILRLYVGVDPLQAHQAIVETLFHGHTAEGDAK